MTDQPTSSRRYLYDEVSALRAVSRREWSGPYREGRGPAYFACGPYWPNELRRKADEMERLAPLYRRAADAMQREMGDKG